MSECYCDYGESPAAYSKTLIKAARVEHGCSECASGIHPGERYERVAMLYEGRWDTFRTCCRCLSVREYITDHAPCFCWLHGSMLDDARDVVNQYGHESAGFYIGAMKRILRAEQRPVPPHPRTPHDPHPR